MTTDEAIVIKKAMLRRIKEKYGDGFNTSAVIIFKDNATLAAERKTHYDLIKDNHFLIVAGAVAIFGIILYILIEKTIK